MKPDPAKYEGTVIGQTLGDALGFVVEGHPPESCSDYVREFLRKDRAGTIGRRPFPFGQYTDDSQLLREMLQSFVEIGAFDPSDYGRRVAALFAEKRIVGRGRATEQAAQRLSHGIPWDQSGTPAPSAGNGSAMRAAAAGLIAPQGGESLVRVAHDQGRITHADPRCSAGAIAIAASVARGIRGADPEPAAFCSELAGLVRDFDPVMVDSLRKLPGWTRFSPEEAVGPIRAVGLNPDYGAWPGISPFVTSSVIWSLYSFLRSPEDYWEVICTSIAVGGDVDTTAAMAGAISGAHLGIDAVPALRERLNDQNTWGCEALIDLSRAACEIVSRP